MVTSRKYLNPSFVVALVALFVALGGVSWAAVKLPRNSVGSSQIKKNAVTGQKVRDGSLDVGDLSTAAQASLRGNTGPQGAQGPQGIQGAAGGFDANKITYRVSTEKTIPANSYTIELTATCSSSEKVLGGGFSITETDDGTGFAWTSVPDPENNRWLVKVDNAGTSAGAGNAYAVCATK